MLYIGCKDAVTTSGSSPATSTTADASLSRVDDAGIFLKDGSDIPLDFSEVDKIYYLIRHAEKVKDGSTNPILSVAGKERSLLLSELMWKARLDKVFTTMTNRTIQTVDTLVRIKGMHMVTYDGKKLDEFAQKLKADQSFKSALIVGHSNTTPTLAGLLSESEFPQISESQYDNIYVVVVRKGKTETYTFKYNS